MERREYETLYRVEHSHWWYRGLHKNILAWLKKKLPDQAGLQLLDAGCGTGLLMQKMQQCGFITGVDFSEYAIQFCAQRELSRVARADISQLPFAEKTFDAIVSADVIYHRNVPDERKALLDFFRVLKPGGLLILNLPAFEFLRSSHDTAIHTQRRFKKDQASDLLRSCGFQIEHLNYRNFLLFPLVVFLRMLRKGKQGDPSSDVVLPGEITNEMLARILFLDDSLANLLPLPFGVSLFCVAKKMM